MHFKPAEVTATVDAVIRSRKTVRAFRAERVPRSLLIEILELARTAPSTFNTQPWRVHVLVGRAKQTLTKRSCRHTLRMLSPRIRPYQTLRRRTVSRDKPTSGSAITPRWVLTAWTWQLVRVRQAAILFSSMHLLA
jgi:predicted oxidoreductase (fatty acid repression mutant protein)